MALVLVTAPTMAAESPPENALAYDLVCGVISSRMRVLRKVVLIPGGA
jgi:hypothetical protein